MTLKLYVDLMSQPSRAVLLFCLETNIPHQVEMVQLMKLQNKTPEFSALNPNRRVPVIDDNGFVLYESHTIMRYLAATRKVADQWYPSDPKARARVDQYLDWHHTNLRPGAAGLVFSKFIGPQMKLPEAALAKQAQEATKALEFSLKLMNTWLSKNDYLCGKKISIADLSASNEISMLGLVQYNLSAHPSVAAWFDRMKQLRHWNDVHSVLNKVLKSAAARAASAGGGASSGKSAAARDDNAFKSVQVFALLRQHLAEDGEALVKQLGASYAFAVQLADKKTQRVWTVDLKNGKGSIIEGDSGTANATFTLADDDFIALASGNLNPQAAFMQGKMKLRGDMSKAMRFNTLVFGNPERVAQFRSALQGTSERRARL